MRNLKYMDHLIFSVYVAGRRYDTDKLAPWANKTSDRQPRLHDNMAESAYFTSFSTLNILNTLVAHVN